jgi:folate-binding protein YgfZ
MSQENIYLDNRRVLKVSGSNCIEFLNNILTLDISKLTPFEARPSALLSPQGRVLFDFLVSLDFPRHSKEESILIEYDLLCEDDLVKKLNMYNLRQEVNVKKTSYNVLVTINPKSSENSIKDKRFFNSDTHVSRIYDKNISLNYNNKGISSNWYDLIRYKNCIPEGIKEIEMNATLPLEINLDLLGGISFEKGCFIGQEVNARVKYKGLVKKKYVPLHLKNKNFSFSNFDKIDNKIYLKTEDIGEVIALSLNQEDDIWYGIGKIKLSQLYLFEENNKLECDFFGSKIKINFPNYMLPLPRKM